MTTNNGNLTFFVEVAQSCLMKRTKQSIVLLEGVFKMLETEERRQAVGREGD